VDKIPTHFDNGTYAPITKVRARPKIGRNDMCSCESGKKNKKCCNTK
jgi:SEC-C motif-containing protein